jgi:hypothetical protein
MKIMQHSSRTRFVDGVETINLSSLYNRRILRQEVHGRRLVTIYAGDPYDDGVPAGKLVCEPAEYPYDGIDPDDVYGLTVTRLGKLFWDLGAFTRNNPLPAQKLRLTQVQYALADQTITADQVRAQARQELPKIGTSCVVNIDERISRNHWHTPGTIVEIDGAFAFLSYTTPVDGCGGLWLQAEQLV